MDKNKLAELREKYWRGETSISEEKAFLENNNSVSTEEEADYFNDLQAFSKLTLDDAFGEKIMAEIENESISEATLRPFIPRVVWQIAAAIALLVGTYVAYQSAELTAPNVEKTIVLQEEDPEKAFEVTKQALLLISQNLNKASEVTGALDKFESAQTKIKQMKENG
ncbi:MAG: hypothetical protein AAF960_19065 [Bacteroidota bacterium]